MRNRIVILLCAWNLCCLVNAQTNKNAYDEYRTRMNKERAAYVEKREQEYAEYRRRINAAYEDYLRRAWEQYTAITGIPRPKEDLVPPVIFDKDYNKDKHKDKEIKGDTILTPKPTPKPEPIIPIIDNEIKEERVSVLLYGNTITARFPSSTTIKLNHLTSEEIATEWDKIVNGAYDNFWADILQQTKQFALCDWAFIELVQLMAESLYGASNEATLVQAATYAYAGYAMRLAVSDTKLYVLLGSQYEIYDRVYYDIDGLHFYPLNCDEDQLQICLGAYENELPFSLDINPEQQYSMQAVSTTERISNKGIHAQCVVNKNLIDFYNTYPTGQIDGNCVSRWAVYANAPMEECVRQSLYPTLQQAIQGMSETQAVDKLLNWVQTAFEYEYDDVVWGHDRAFFPSESLHYPYCDCEDRSILFSRIVRDLLNLDVVLIYYPGHLATAVHFNEPVKGDYVMLYGAKYIVCDPTYIGAPVGITMPDMDNQTAKLIPLRR